MKRAAAYRDADDVMDLADLRLRDLIAEAHALVKAIEKRKDRVGYPGNERYSPALRAARARADRREEALNGSNEDGALNF
jgi:hypothetical protein